jgi:hypothetical protein
MIFLLLVQASCSAAQPWSAEKDAKVDLRTRAAPRIATVLDATLATLRRAVQHRELAGDGMCAPGRSSRVARRRRQATRSDCPAMHLPTATSRNAAMTNRSMAGR